MNDPARLKKKAIHTAPFRMFAPLLAVLATAIISDAQQPEPSPPPAAPSAADAQSDKEWLIAYMMAHEGYRLNHMDALEDKFDNMSPTQLGVLRDLYEHKHQAMVRRQQLFERAQDQQLAWARSQTQRQRQAMNTISEAQSEAALQREQSLDQMHREAAENAAQKNWIYPYGMGGYPASPYAYPYRSPYYMQPVQTHPYFNPLYVP